MKIQGYEAYIPGGMPVSINGVDGYYSLRHGQTFSIALINHNLEKCVVQVYIENDPMGQPILAPFERLSLEGKIGSGKLFTLYASNTAEAIQVGEQVLTPAEKGLIRVQFYPEKRQGSVQQYKGIARGGDQTLSIGGNNRESFSAGVVGMSGVSNQKFESVRFNADYSKGVEINLRLLVDRATYVEAPTPISPRRNMVPPPIL